MNTTNFDSGMSAWAANAMRKSIMDIERRLFDHPRAGIPMHFTGLTVMINSAFDDQPRMQVSARFADLMPADYVAELNAWMLERFGKHNTFYVHEGRTLFCGEKGFAQIKATIEKQ